jgi:hypothetical protein
MPTAPTNPAAPRHLVVDQSLCNPEILRGARGVTLHPKPDDPNSLPLSIPSSLPIQDLKPAIFPLINYTPHSVQVDFHQSPARFKVLVAGTRFGKSLAAAHDVLAYLLKPNTRGWIVGPTYRLAEKEFRYLAQAFTALNIPKKNYKIRYGGETGPSSIKTAWGAEALTLSAVHPHNLLGEEVDWLIVAESSRIKPDVWDHYLRARTTSRLGCALFASTPHGHNWYELIHDRGHDLAHPLWQTFNATTADNPLIDPGDIIEAQRTIHPSFFDEQYLGKFVSADGQVFTEFNPAIHVADNIAHDPNIRHWRTVAGMDFGFKSPSHLIWGYTSPGGRVIITGEHIVRFQNSVELAEAAERLGLHGANNIYCDPSSPDFIQDMVRLGMNACGIKSKIEKGIHKISERLRNMAIDGKPGLIIDASCTELIRQLKDLCWEPNRRSNGDMLPKKGDDHGVDALRYLLCGLNSQPREIPNSTNGMVFTSSTGWTSPGVPPRSSAASGVSDSLSSPTNQPFTPAAQNVDAAAESRGQPQTIGGEPSRAPEQTAQRSAESEQHSSKLPSSSVSVPAKCIPLPPRPRQLSWQARQQLPQNMGTPDCPDTYYWSEYNRLLREEDKIAAEREMHRAANRPRAP